MGSQDNIYFVCSDPRGVLWRLPCGAPLLPALLPQAVSGLSMKSWHQDARCHWPIACSHTYKQLKSRLFPRHPSNERIMLVREWDSTRRWRKASLGSSFGEGKTNILQFKEMRIPHLGCKSIVCAQESMNKMSSLWKKIVIECLLVSTLF